MYQEKTKWKKSFPPTNKHRQIFDDELDFNSLKFSFTPLHLSLVNRNHYSLGKIIMAGNLVLEMKYDLKSNIEFMIIISLLKHTVAGPPTRNLPGGARFWKLGHTCFTTNAVSLNYSL